MKVDDDLVMDVFRLEQHKLYAKCYDLLMVIPACFHQTDEHTENITKVACRI